MSARYGDGDGAEPVDDDDGPTIDDCCEHAGKRADGDIFCSRVGALSADVQSLKIDRVAALELLSERDVQIAGYIKTLNRIHATSGMAGSPPPLGFEGTCEYQVRQMRERLNAIEKLLPYLDDGCLCSHNEDDGIEGKCVACQARELLKDKRWRLF